MSTLGDAVQADLAKRGLTLGVSAIDGILGDAGVSLVSSHGVPVRLRVRRLQVTGMKTFRDPSAASAGDAESAVMVTAPIDLDWSPTDGVNGVGSEVNLRGKSSVLHFATWALTGRTHLQADVLAWVTTVRTEFTIDGVPIYVEISMSDGEPHGTVEQGIPSGRTVLGRFAGHSEFESLMGSLMLERLRLDVISVFANGVETEHAWPTYAGALTVHADKLDPIVGNVQELKTRILQMFVGTGWAAVGAQVANALNARTFERKQEREKVASSASAPKLAEAEHRVRQAKLALDAFDPSEPDVDAVFALASTATHRAQEENDLALQLMSMKNAAAEVQGELRAEELRAQAAAEDAVAERLFNGMAPTACPRCARKVTAERYAAEATEHECSVCSADLEIELIAEDHAQVAVKGDRDTAEGVGMEGDPEDEEDAVDPLTALRQAVDDVNGVIDELTARHQEARARRLAAVAEVQTGRASLESARARLQAELEFARAEAAFDAMQQSVAERPPPGPLLDEEYEVLSSADRLVKAWVKTDQDPLLENVSFSIAELARRFGAGNITSISLKGNGNMDVFKGGARSGYSGLTNGEKLRVKLATAIALIKLGHDQGVGRHPGLLFVDSPAAEEVPEADLRIMLEAMTAVAEDTDLQIFVATTHGPMLSTVLPPPSLLVATGNDFVW